MGLRETGFLVGTGEVAGSATDAAFPSLACRLVKIKAAAGNAGKVYIGLTGVTKVDGTTDTTTGYQLVASAETDWIPLRGNLNELHRICDNAADAVTYIALA